MERNEAIAALMTANAGLRPIVAIQSVQATDRTFSTLRSTTSDGARIWDQFPEMNPVYGGPILGRNAVAADVVAYGAVVNAATDMIAVVNFAGAITNGIRPKPLHILGYLITHRYTTNQVAAAFDLTFRSFISVGPGVAQTELNRDIIISPQGGANTVTEYLILPALPSGTFSYDAATSAYTAAVAQRTGHLSTYKVTNAQSAVSVEMGYAAQQIFVFVGQQAVAQNITVVPIIGHTDSVSVMAPMVMNPLLNRELNP